MTSLLWIVVIVAPILAITWHLGLHLPKKFRERRCAGKLWKEQFPQADTATIREFLMMVTKAFGIRRKYATLFYPYDKLNELRDTFNPIKGIDQLEVEALGVYVKKEYGVDMARFWHRDITLGDVFSEILKRY